MYSARVHCGGSRTAQPERPGRAKTAVGDSQARGRNQASPFRLTPTWYINRLSFGIGSQLTATNSSVSIVVSIPACHAGDLGSIPRRNGISLGIHQPKTVGVSHLFPSWRRSTCARLLLGCRPALRRGGSGPRDFCSHSQVEGLTPYALARVLREECDSCTVCPSMAFRAGSLRRGERKPRGLGELSMYML
jgi:hypothetical protein